MTRAILARAMLLPTVTDIVTYNIEVCYMGLAMLLPNATTTATYDVEVCYMVLSVLLRATDDAATRVSCLWRDLRRGVRRDQICYNLIFYLLHTFCGFTTVA